MKDYQPRKRPLIPVGHRTWCAVSRVKERRDNLEDHTPADMVEWLLEAITRPGADQAQRQMDLIDLAELVLKCRGEQVVLRRNAEGKPTSITYANGLDPNVGYGLAPIDSDTHDPDCTVCGDAAVYDNGGHDYDFDRHPYTTRSSE